MLSGCYLHFGAGPFWKFQPMTTFRDVNPLAFNHSTPLGGCYPAAMSPLMPPKRSRFGSWPQSGRNALASCAGGSRAHRGRAAGPDPGPIPYPFDVWLSDGCLILTTRAFPINTSQSLSPISLVTGTK